MGTMQHTDLETFVLAVQEQSLSAAARRLFISQPAVSARIRRLETEVGESLLRRSGRGVRPSASGSRLYDRALPLLRELRILDQEFVQAGSLAGRLTIGATDLVAVHRLPALLPDLRREHSGLEISVRVEGTATLLEQLDQGAIEMALGTLPVRGPRFETTPLYRDPLILVADPEHPLSRRRSVLPKALADEVWIVHKPESISRQLVDGFFAGHGIGLRVEMEISSPEAIKELVHARLGLAALPLCSVERDIDDGRLAKIRVRGFDLERVSGLILRRDGSLSRAAQAMRDRLLEQT